METAFEETQRLFLVVVARVQLGKENPASLRGPLSGGVATPGRSMVGLVGIEPTTRGLSSLRSTI